MPRPAGLSPARSSRTGCRRSSSATASGGPSAAAGIAAGGTDIAAFLPDQARLAAARALRQAGTRPALLLADGRQIGELLRLALLGAGEEADVDHVAFDHLADRR